MVDFIHQIKKGIQIKFPELESISDIVFIGSYDLSQYEMDEINEFISLIGVVNNELVRDLTKFSKVMCDDEILLFRVSTKYLVSVRDGIDMNRGPEVLSLHELVSL